jgi:hypothetical protein
MKMAPLAGPFSIAECYFGTSLLQTPGRDCHSSHQKPHFEQPPTISPKATTLATMVSHLNTRNLTLSCNYRGYRERQNR